MRNPTEKRVGWQRALVEGELIGVLLQVGLVGVAMALGQIYERHPQLTDLIVPALKYEFMLHITTIPAYIFWRIGPDPRFARFAPKINNNIIDGNWWKTRQKIAEPPKQLPPPGSFNS